MTIATQFDAFEIHGCRMLGGEVNNHHLAKQYVEQCDDGEARFWTLYGHAPGEGLHSIGDFASREEAVEIMERLNCPDAMAFAGLLNAASQAAHVIESLLDSDAVSICSVAGDILAGVCEELAAAIGIATPKGAAC